MNRLLLFFVFFLSFLGFAQEQATRTWELVAPIPFERSIDSAELKTTITWIERIEERTYFSKFFRSESGQTRQVFSSVPVHYAGTNGQL